MKDQIIQLFSEQYNIAFETFSETFENFYEHPFQADKCIRLVAVDGEKVMGFQSFFFWPCSFGSKTYRGFQSGNSLVHPDARGKGVFGRLLAYVFDNQEKLEYDMLIGFPVEVSFGSFIRKNWSNPFDLQWFVKMSNPLRAMFSGGPSALKNRFSTEASDFAIPENRFQVDINAEFQQYRDGYTTGEYFYHTWTDGHNRIVFQLKMQVRKRIIHECIIGKVQATTFHPDTLTLALKEVLRLIRKSGAATIVSFAFNPLDRALILAVEKNGFRKIDKIIRFIHYGELPQELQDPGRWAMFRADIDTW